MKGSFLEREHFHAFIAIPNDKITLLEIINYCYYCVCNLYHRVPSGNIHSFVFSSFNVLLAEFSFLAAC